MLKGTALLLVVVAISLSAGIVHAATRVVSTTTPDCTGGSSPYSTIQAAISASADNDKIVVCPGTYTENIAVSVSVEIRSYSQDASSVTVQAANQNDHVFAITRNVNISGLTIKGATGTDKAGIYSEWNKINISNCNVSSNYDNIRLAWTDNSIISNNVLGSGTYGVYAWSSNRTVVERNTITSHGCNGISLDSSHYNIIANNTVKSNSCPGILLGGSSPSSNNNITGNDISANRYEGIFLLRSSNNNIINNTVNSNVQYLMEYYGGIHLDSSNSNNIINNTAKSNTYAGIYLKYSNDTNVINNSVSDGKEGVIVSFSSNNRVRGNVIERHTDYADNIFGMGIDIFSTYNTTISGNVVRLNSKHGIFVYATNNTVENNTVERNGYSGVYLQGDLTSRGDNNTVSGNNVSSNDYGIISRSKNNTIKNNIASLNNYSIALQGPMDYGYNAVLNNTVTSSIYGIYLYLTKRHSIVNNTVRLNSYGIALQSSDYNNITNNTVDSNAYGINLSSSVSNSISDGALLNSTSWDFKCDKSTGNTVRGTYINTSRFSFSGIDFAVRSVPAPPADPPEMHNISSYLNVSAAGWIYLNASYMPDNLDGVNLYSLRMYRYSGANWTIVSGTNGVNIFGDYVYANVSGSGIVAPIGNKPPSIMVSTNRYVILDDPWNGSNNGAGFGNPSFNWKYGNGSTADFWESEATTIRAYALYLNDSGLPKGGVAINFTLRRPDGAWVSGSTIQTNADGVASASFDVNKNYSNGYGYWTIEASNGTASSSINFIYNYWGCGNCHSYKSLTGVGTVTPNTPYYHGYDKIHAVSPHNSMVSTRECTFCHRSYGSGATGSQYPVDMHNNKKTCHACHKNDFTQQSTPIPDMPSCYNVSAGCHPQKNANVSSAATLNASALDSENRPRTNYSDTTPAPTGNPGKAHSSQRVPCVICHGPMHNIRKPNPSPATSNNYTEDSQCRSCHYPRAEHNDAVSCTICHSQDAHAVKYFNATGNYAANKTSAGYCATCHQNSTLWETLKNSSQVIYTGGAAPQVPAPFEHSNGSKWGNYWDGTNVTKELSPDASTAVLLHMNEGSGQHIYDASTGGNNGTLGPSDAVEGADPVWANGKFGKALSFDGVQQYAMVPDSDNLDFDVNDSFTIEAWIRFSGSVTSGLKEIVQKYEGGNKPGYHLSIQGSGGSTPGALYFMIHDNAMHPGYAVDIKDSLPLNDSAWHHVAAVRNISGTARTASVYVDGALRVSAADAATQSSANTLPLYIGARNASGTFNSFFSGGIDEVHVTRRVKSQSEIVNEIAGSNAGAQNACIYCHDKTYHSSAALGRPSIWKGINTINSSLSPENNWCAGCHYQKYTSGTNSYADMASAFQSSLLPVPPEITNHSVYAPSGASGYYNHSFLYYSDAQCKGCHGSLIGQYANMTEFMHKVAVGKGCIGCHFDYGYMSAQGKPEKFVNETLFRASVHGNSSVITCEDCHTNTSGHPGANPPESGWKWCEDCHAVKPTYSNLTPTLERQRHNLTDKPQNIYYNISGVLKSAVTVNEPGDCVVCHDATIYNKAVETYNGTSKNCRFCHSFPDSLPGGD